MVITAFEMANLRAPFRWALPTMMISTAPRQSRCTRRFLDPLWNNSSPACGLRNSLNPHAGFSIRDWPSYMRWRPAVAAARFDDGIRYAEAALLAIDSRRFDEVPFRFRQ